MLRRPLLVLTLAALLLPAAGCTVSNIQGPQIVQVPQGFGFDPEASSTRVVFRDGDTVARRGYFLRDDNGNASILLTAYAGAMTEAQVRTHHAEERERWGRSGVAVDDVEEHEVDDRTAWGWFERHRRSRRYVLVVPYDEVTWTVDFYSSVRGSQDDGFIRSAALSFKLDPRSEERAMAHGFLITGIVLALLVAWLLRRKRQYKRARHRADFSR